MYTYLQAAHRDRPVYLPAAQRRPHRLASDCPQSASIRLVRTPAGIPGRTIRCIPRPPALGPHGGTGVAHAVLDPYWCGNATGGAEPRRGVGIVFRWGWRPFLEALRDGRGHVRGSLRLSAMRRAVYHPNDIMVLMQHPPGVIAVVVVRPI